MGEKLREILSRRGEELAETLFQRAVDGDMKALAMIRELAAEDAQDGGADGAELADGLSAMSDDELRLLRSHLLGRADGGADGG